MGERTGFPVGRYTVDEVLDLLEAHVAEHGIALAVARGARSKRVLAPTFRRLKAMQGKGFAGCPAEMWQYLFAENTVGERTGLLHVWSTTGEHFPVEEMVTAHIVANDGSPGVMVQLAPAGGPLRPPPLRQS